LGRRSRSRSRSRSTGKRRENLLCVRHELAKPKELFGEQEQKHR
jgi:hypothetical protein